MIKSNFNSSVSFYELDWDTNFFGVTSAKAILHNSLISSEWDELKSRFIEYEFISIENRNSEPINAQMIGRNTSSFLADVNIQFIKNLDGTVEGSKDIIIHQALPINKQILEIADFQFSKFIEDNELAKRGGADVYNQWLISSFDNSNKYYAISKDEKGDLNGFLLHSYLDNVCVVELIGVSKNVTKNGVGTRLFKAVENASYQRGSEVIKVGTQMRNMGAINFYHKLGCKQVGCHQVYHLWNL
ncbi:MAG: GNAT family N-acetyltransferase [Bacillota bacterium]